MQPVREPFVHQARIRVRYAETDQMGVAYHSNHIVWMEVGRVEYCRALGLVYAEMERSGVLLAVVEVQCRYHAPLRYDEEVTIATRVEQLGTRGMRFAYELRSAESGRLAATGYTRHIFCDPQLRPMRLPERWRELFDKAAAPSEG